MKSVLRSSFSISIAIKIHLPLQLQVAQAGIELDNNSFLAHRLVGLSYWALQLHEEAVQTLSNLIRIANRHQHAVSCLIWVYCSMGNYEEAQALMDELESRAKTEYIAGMNLGLSAAWLGDVEKALTYLEKAYQDHDPTFVTLQRDPNVPASIRQDSRFQNLLVRIGFNNLPTNANSGNS